MYGGLTSSKDLLATDRVKIWIVKGGVVSVRKRVKYITCNGSNYLASIMILAAGSLPTKVRVSHFYRFSGYE